MIALDGFRVTNLRISMPWIGAWSADAEVDLGDRDTLPAGKATLEVNGTMLACSVDAAQSGTFAGKGKVRVVAGAGGWEKVVPSSHYHNDAGVPTTSVFGTTAAVVGERVVETEAGRFGIDFTRDQNAASRIFAGLTWFVDATGTTIVGPRAVAPAAPDVRVLDWDAREKIATLGADGLVLPGTILTDSRFGTTKVRDVEQTWGDAGARVTARCIDVDATPAPAPLAGNAIVATVGAIATEAVGAKWLGAARYRVDTQLGDGRFEIQPFDEARGLPYMRAISLAPAVPGMSVKVPVGTILHVVFADGDKSRPVIVRFETNDAALEVDFDAEKIRLGDAAATGVATLESQTKLLAALANLAASLTAFTTVATNSTIGLVDGGGYAAKVAEASSQLTAALATPADHFSKRVTAAS